VTSLLITMMLTQIPIFVNGTLRSDGPNAHLIAPDATDWQRAEAWGSLHHGDDVDEKGACARTVNYSAEGPSRSTHGGLGPAAQPDTDGIVRYSPATHDNTPHRAQATPEGHA